MHGMAEEALESPHLNFFTAYIGFHPHSFKTMRAILVCTIDTNFAVAFSVAQLMHCNAKRFLMPAVPPILI